MARLGILHYPDARLRTRAQRVDAVDGEIAQLIDDLFETMYAANGIGLAATQVNVHRRVLVVDCSGTGGEPRAFVNPEIVARAGERTSEEGCLSVPGAFDRVARAERIRVRALDRSGAAFELEAGGLLAVCLQHEMDHLDGRLFIDYLSELERRRLAKLARETATGADAPAGADSA